MVRLHKNALVVKRNALNELRNYSMTLQEQRFFIIYLSKIDTRHTETRTVSFPIEDFRRIMGFGKLNIAQLKTSTDSLLCKIVHIPDEKGGFLSFPLFKRCRVYQNDDKRWFVEIDASDDALPLMFNFKRDFFKYELWNALRLKSQNQVRMYEILKQWLNQKKSFTKEFAVTELRELLYIDQKEYDRWDNFKRKVLDACQQALKESTDLCYTYERGEVGRGGKWLTIIFHIKKNTEYVDQLTLEEFIERQPENDDTVTDQSVNDNNIIEVENTTLSDLAEAVHNEFSKGDIQEIYKILNDNNIQDDEKRRYLARAYQKFEELVSRKNDMGEPVYNRFAYFKAILNNELNPKIAKSPKKKEHAYDGDEILAEILAQFRDEDKI